jgi:trehalose 6-phosphate synthase
MTRPALFVVSNREPYMHTRQPDGSIACTPTTGGVAVALDALLRERGGTWIAHGAGDADRLVVDARDRVRVPPDAPAYTLKRIWLSAEEERRYYGGFSNEGLWPMCHIAHVRPIFRSEDWAEYRAVNARFADAIASELTDPSAPVFIQDYHLALVASELRRRRPEAKSALFWHIPWPSPDRLRMCPWRRDILAGLLANDLLAFQLERDRRNFLLCVRDEMAATIDHSTVHLAGHSTHVVSAPIGVDYDRIAKIAGDRTLASEKQRLQRDLRLGRPDLIVGVGVDRLDYTKGIPERLEAIDRLLSRSPELRDRLVFVQVGVPSRSKLESYASIEREIDAIVDAINQRHGHGGIGPIRYRKSALKIRRLVALYQLADFCIVSSLHDGMNLVAKEFVAARSDEQGVLVLSEMTGAAQELTDALIINPYDIDGFAAAIRAAIDMPADERRRRMRAMRRVVAGHDVFVWASNILEGLERIGPKPRVVRGAEVAVPMRPFAQHDRRLRSSMPHAERALAGEVHRLARGRHLLVLLDFDGTLCEFEADPNQVYLSESRRDILRRLQQHATVGVVSGRRLEDVRGRCAVEGLIVAGLHGLEIEGLGERYVHPDLDAATAAVQDAASRLRDSVSGLRGVFVEDKKASVALHFREADAEGQRQAIEAFAEAAGAYVDSGQLRVMRGSYVLELLPNIEWNKGNAVHWIADRVRRQNGDVFVVYIGDDVTDQDAFAAIEGDGMPIAASDRVTANTHLDGPVAVERFLGAL